MQVVSHDVIEHLSKTHVISSATNRNHPDSPAEVLGRRAGAFAQFRHVTTGTKDSRQNNLGFRCRGGYGCDNDRPGGGRRLRGGAVTPAARPAGGGVARVSCWG